MPLVEWSVAKEVMPGQTRSGDHYLVEERTEGIFLAAVDSLGHGEDAAQVAELAVNSLRRLKNGSLLSMLHHCQEELRGTRGAVLSMASLSAAHDSMSWLGVGNVAGVLIRGDTGAVPRQEFLLLRSGVVGERLPPISVSTVPLSYGDMLIFATDGIREGFSEKLNLNVSAQEIAQDILERHWRRSDDALVLVARYVHKHDAPRN